MKIRLKDCALCGHELTTDSEPVLPTTVRCDSCGAYNVLDDHRSPVTHPPHPEATDDDTDRLMRSELLDDEWQEYAERLEERMWA